MKLPSPDLAAAGDARPMALGDRDFFKDFLDISAEPFFIMEYSNAYDQLSSR
jgi:hypothetical protein